MNERSKIIKLLINGNDQYKGKIISITRNRFVNFNVFLDQLTAYFKAVMPNGVRKVYRFGSFHLIQRLDELENYGCYICCSHERLKKMAYDCNFIDKTLLSQSERKNFRRNKINNRVLDGSIIPNSKMYNDIEETKDFYIERIKDENSPKLVKIVFNDKPHDVYKIFINRNLELSLKDCLYNISININRKMHKHEKIKIFTVSGREITTLSELYINRSPVLAFTNPIVMYPNDVKEMILSLFPDRRRAERYFSKWLLEEESDRVSSHSMRLQSSASSNSNNSKEKFTRNEKYISSYDDNILSNREKQFINKINNRQSEIEKYENDKFKREINYSGRESFRGISKDRKDSRASNIQDKLKIIRVDKYTQISPKITLEKMIQAYPSLRHFGKVTQVSPRIVHFSKMTQFVHNVRHLDKLTQIQSQNKHLDKDFYIAPRFVHLSTGMFGDIKQPLKIFHEKGSDFNLESQEFTKYEPKNAIKRNSTNMNNSENFLSKDYKLVEILSESNHSKVFLAENLKREKLVIKKIQLKNEFSNPENESQILLSCDHRNIIQCFEVLKSEYYVEMVMEFMSDGNMEIYLSEKEIYEEDIMKFVKDVGSGLFYLHSVGLIHRYIEPRNIYFHSNPLTFKIGGMSRAIQYSENMVYTENWPQNIYSAPELQLTDKYNEKIDIWSLGVIINNIVCKTYQQEIIEKEFVRDLDNPNWSDWSYDCKLLVNEMVKEDPTARYKALQVLCHPWLTQTRNRDIIQSQLFDEMETFNRLYIDTSII